MEILTHAKLSEGTDVSITLDNAEHLALFAAGGTARILRAIKEAINIGRAALGEQPVEKGFPLGRMQLDYTSEHHTYTIGFSSNETEALLAAGRAAGCIDLKNTIYGVIDDVIGTGCSTLRMIEDIHFDLDLLKAQGSQAANAAC